MNNKSAVTVGGQIKTTWSADSKSLVTVNGAPTLYFEANTKQNKIVTFVKTFATSFFDEILDEAKAGGN